MSDTKTKNNEEEREGVISRNSSAIIGTIAGMALCDDDLMGGIVGGMIGGLFDEDGDLW